MADTLQHRMTSLRLKLPKPWVLPDDTKINASFVRVKGERVLVSGHLPLDSEGRITGPFGRVGQEVSLEEATIAARNAMLGILASLERELGALDSITGWMRVFGMINAASGFDRYPEVMCEASQLLLDLFGPEIGSHARVAIGVNGLPFNAPVEIEAEVEIANRRALGTGIPGD